MKSTYETLNLGKTETSVPHYSDELVPHNLPMDIFPDGETYIDEAKLEKWARDSGNMHSILQLGIQQGLIKVRATFKAKKKDLEWTVKDGQAAVDAWKWPVQGKPKTKKSAEEIAKEYLAQLSPAELKKFLASK